MIYYVRLSCPRCGLVKDTTVGGLFEKPRMYCDPCLLNDNEDITMTIEMQRAVIVPRKRKQNP